MVAVAILTVLSASCSRHDTSSDDDAAVKASASHAPPVDGGPIDLGAPASRGPIDFTRTEIQAKREALFKQYKCRTDHCESELLGASSPLEATWLQSRGFPTPERAEELENMTLGELELAAEKSDLAAQVVLGRRMWDQGNKVDGREQMFEAAAKGSVYADYQLSRAEKSSNPLDSAAYLRRAYLQGDTKAAMQLYSTFPDLGAADWNTVDNRAMALYRALLVTRANKGRMQYGPRP
jgi:hypothetical protein